MSSPAAAWLGALFALVVAWTASGLLQWCGPVDRPRGRSMHAVPTPTSGGLALLAGVAVALIATAPAIRRSPSVDLAFAAAFAVALAHGLLGALDDVVDFGAKTKLGLQLILAAAFAVIAHPSSIPLTRALSLPLPLPLAVCGAALWMLVTVNAVNFMDGANGLVAGALALVVFGLGLRCLSDADVALAALLMGAAGACLGFLPWNYPKARLFQGDAGALFLGALIAAAAVVACDPSRPGGSLSLFTVPIAITPLLTDVLLTLLVRARRKSRLFEAHKDHLYQRWLAAHGTDHADLARRLWLMVGAYTLAGMGVAKTDPWIAAAVFSLGVGLSIASWLWLDRRLERSKPSG